MSEDRTYLECKACDCGPCRASVPFRWGKRVPTVCIQGTPPVETRVEWQQVEKPAADRLVDLLRALIAEVFEQIKGK